MLKSAIRSILFSVGEALRSLKNNKGVTLLTMGTISVAMTFMGFFFIILTNLDGAIESIKKQSELILYLKDDSSVKDIDRIKSVFKKNDGIEKVTYISKEKALAEFRKNFKWDQSVIKEVGENPLPASFVISLKKNYSNIEVMNRIATTFSKLSGVEEVEFGKEWVERLELVISFVQLGILILGWLLAAGLLFIISNTIRLSVYSRMDDIEIMKLVGATHRFIKIPFIIEGTLQGLLGTFVSIVFLYIGHTIIIGRLTESISVVTGLQSIAFLPSKIIFEMILGGMAVGLVGANIALFHAIRIRE